MTWLVCRRCGVTAEAGDLICGGCAANLAEPGAVVVAPDGDGGPDPHGSGGDRSGGGSA